MTSNTGPGGQPTAMAPKLDTYDLVSIHNLGDIDSKTRTAINIAWREEGRQDLPLSVYSAQVSTLGRGIAMKHEASPPEEGEEPAGDTAALPQTSTGTTTQQGIGSWVDDDDRLDEYAKKLLAKTPKPAATPATPNVQDATAALALATFGGPSTTNGSTQRRSRGVGPIKLPYNNAWLTGDCWETMSFQRKNTPEPQSAVQHLLEGAKGEQQKNPNQIARMRASPKIGAVEPQVLASQWLVSLLLEEVARCLKGANHDLTAFELAKSVLGRWCGSTSASKAMMERLDIAISNLNKAWDANDQPTFERLAHGLRPGIGNFEPIIAAEEQGKKFEPNNALGKQRTDLITAARSQLHHYVTLETNVLTVMRSQRKIVVRDVLGTWQNLFSPCGSLPDGLNHAYNDLASFFDSLLPDTENLLGTMKDMLQKHFLALQRAAADSTAHESVFQAMSGNFERLARAVGDGHPNCLVYQWLRQKMEEFQVLVLNSFYYIKRNRVPKLAAMKLIPYVMLWRDVSKQFYGMILPNVEDFYWTDKDATELYDNTVEPNRTQYEIRLSNKAGGN